MGNEGRQISDGYLPDGSADIIEDILEDLIPEFSYFFRYDGDFNFFHKNKLIISE